VWPSSVQVEITVIVATKGTHNSNVVEDLFVQVDGVRVHYRRAGSGPPLLLIHGLVGSARNWNRNIEGLSRDATVYAIDLLNMGESDRVPGLDAGLEATADFVAHWMQAVGLTEVDVAGVSHGGAIAMTLASRHPAQVRKLILFAPANPFCDLGRQLIAFYKTRPGQWLARLIPSLPRFVKATALGRMYGDPSHVTQEALEGYTDGLAIPGTVDHVLAIVRRWYVDMGLLRSALPRLANRSVLMIWGDRDRAVGLSSARELQQVLPNSQLIVLPGAGHLAFEEAADVCNRAMRDWLAAEQVTFKIRPSSEKLQRLEAI
jgi:4,5:9,10-diseco-3-hydroxy-5,9,17-trioxoandrosta-1(10),2-diene-4-oate hydrolase